MFVIVHFHAFILFCSSKEVLFNFLFVFFMKKKATTFATLCFSVAAFSASCVVVEQTDGTKSEFLLSTNPKIIYSPDSVILTTSDAEFLFYYADEVKKVYMSESQTIQNVGLEKIKPNDKTVSFAVNETSLKVSGVNANETVVFYAFDGKALLGDKADNNGMVEFPLEGLPKGVYVVKTNSQTFKVVRK